MRNDSPAKSSAELVPLRQDVAATVETDADVVAAPAPVLFLSYSRRDKLAEDVYGWLVERGYQVWRDKSSIPGAADWRASIERGIRNCDMFILLLSPNVVRHAEHVKQEVQLANACEKPIIPAVLKRISALPEGSELILQPLEQIDLFSDFNEGMTKLVEAIGATPFSEIAGGYRGRATRLLRRGRRLARQKEIGSKVMRYGGAAIAGGVAVLAAASKVAESRASEQRLVERGVYIERTLELLTRAMQEVQMTSTMSPREYREEFRPQIMRILGSLESTTPDSPSLVAWHKKLVSNLDGVVREFDDAADRFERGEEGSYQRSIIRLNTAWSETLDSSVLWLRSAVEVD